MKSVATSRRNSVRTRGSGPGYEDDFYVWLLSQAAALKERRFRDVDLENLIEEVEALAGSLRRELRNRLKLILVHLLKWQFQPSKRSNSWDLTLSEQRDQVQQLLEQSPSLRQQVSELTAKTFAAAAKTAGKEMKLDQSQWEQIFPTDCPWTPEQILDEEYLPNGARTNGARKRG